MVKRRTERIRGNRRDKTCFKNRVLFGKYVRVGLFGQVGQIGRSMALAFAAI